MASTRVRLMTVVYVPPPVLSVSVCVCFVSLHVPLDSTALQGKWTGGSVITILPSLHVRFNGNPGNG